MQTENYRKYIILALSVALIFLIIEVKLFWNAFLNEKSAPGIWPFICVIAIILALGYTLNISLKATNLTIFRETIDKEVAKERLRILKDFEKKEEVQQQNSDSEIIENKIKEIIPKGNFKNIDSLLAKYLKTLSGAIEIVQGIVYIKDENTQEFNYSTGYAITNEKNITSFKAGETLPGQVALVPEIAFVSEIPDEYFTAESGLGQAKPKHLAFVPILNNNIVVAVLELATFKEISRLDKEALKLSAQEISIKLAQNIKS
jgi:GAF domain-containing protein